MDFGEYKVGVTESGGYELLRGNNVISMFAEARIEKDRILFPLSHGTLLEISSSGISARCSNKVILLLPLP